MSTRLTEAIQSAAERAVTQLGSSWLMATVTAANAGGTVDVTTARGPVAGIRRLKSYASPVVGDVVVVLTNANGNWVVVGALA
ncbi:hypothetical protein SAMN02745831_00384 [Streptomyces sp. PgraA7]|nr:hypothetical protein [Streptomyces sp. SID8378]SNB63964.1 hypothetical protein SAMN02745831_00384 [Streptomyces sp. PgraA7]